jgi:hypothetical protein
MVTLNGSGDEDEQAAPVTWTLADVERDLWATMRRLAEPADQQIAWLVRLHAQHSLEALAEDWQSMAIPQYIAQDLLTTEEAAAVLAIDRILSQLKAAHGWGLGTVEVLPTDPNWAAIRRLAADAVAIHDARAVEWVDPEFLALFAQLRPSVDWRVDPADEHDRWSVYAAIVGDLTLRPVLLACIVRDPDHSMASAALVEVLEISPAADRQSMFEAAPTLHTKIVRSRMTELPMLERFRDGPDGAPPAPMTAAEGEHILAASNWFQTRMIAEATALDALSLLAEHGPSRRIRTGALERRQQVAERPLLARFTDPNDTREATPEEIERLFAASAELQRRVAAEGMAANALRALAERGRTHRIRGYARDRLHRIGRAG